MGENQRATVAMTDDEVAAFIAASRTATLATIGPNAFPHLTAMWFGLVDGVVCFETKAKSQKVVNLRREPRVACMLEAGNSYDQLRGVAVEGMARIVDDSQDPRYWAAAESLYERYNGPVSDETRPQIERMMHNRVVVRIEPMRIRSWDHRKLGMPAIPVAGTTATSSENP
jgi:PPOX class probable F420-dependent enzyme